MAARTIGFGAKWESLEKALDYSVVIHVRMKQNRIMIAVHVMVEVITAGTHSAPCSRMCQETYWDGNGSNVCFSSNLSYLLNLLINPSGNEHTINDLNMWNVLKHTAVGTIHRVTTHSLFSLGSLFRLSVPYDCRFSKELQLKKTFLQVKAG